jgi:hypothetical protein
MAYFNYYQLMNETRIPHPLPDYYQGSLCDNFDFGAFQIYRSDVLKKAASAMPSYRFAGLYDLRLRASEVSRIEHVNDYLYTVVQTDFRRSGEKQFDYLDAHNREAQLEMEEVCTQHLKRIDAYLPPSFLPVSFDEADFPLEASIIIPVKNRAKTIADAIHSGLEQQTSFPFNLIVVDNHSTDGTTQIINDCTCRDNRVVHLIPQQENLGIGGCWNEAVNHQLCGKFAVQLDSDDLYSSPNTLQTIVNAFYEQGCAMTVGSYLTTDFNLTPIPPGIIDHREWTDENGRNNALRINGLGAPRAFYTPLYRKINAPNISYGEDYALGLAFSRDYRIGRIYDVLYLCRRWEENSDADLDLNRIRLNSEMKDSIRTKEIYARIHKNSDLISKS